MILYPKPNTTKLQLKELVKKNSTTRIFSITNKKSNIKTCICEIFPSSYIKPKKILIFSHGNGCDIFTFYPYLLELANRLEVLVVCWDYPQYSLSEGELFGSNKNSLTDKALFANSLIRECLTEFRIESSVIFAKVDESLSPDTGTNIKVDESNSMNAISSITFDVSTLLFVSNR